MSALTQAAPRCTVQCQWDGPTAVQREEGLKDLRIRNVQVQLPGSTTEIQLKLSRVIETAASQRINFTVGSRSLEGIRISLEKAVGLKLIAQVFIGDKNVNTLEIGLVVRADVKPDTTYILRITAAADLALSAALEATEQKAAKAPTATAMIMNGMKGGVAAATAALKLLFGKEKEAPAPLAFPGLSVPDLQLRRAEAIKAFLRAQIKYFETSAAGNQQACNPLVNKVATTGAAVDTITAAIIDRGATPIDPTGAVFKALNDRVEAHVATMTFPGMAT